MPPPPGGAAKPEAKAETAKPAAPAKPTVATLPPVKGSHLAADKNGCLQCHGESDLWDAKSRNRYISKESLDKDVHAQHGVNCIDCHGGNPNALDIRDVPHAVEDGFRAKEAEIRKFCAHCHQKVAFELRTSVHSKAGQKNDQGSATPLECTKCHGPVMHQTLPVRDKASPVYLDRQVNTCGECHQKDLQTYVESVHGRGLKKLGLLVSAVCADCHGAHGIYRPLDNQSTLHATKVADTCGRCHRFIEERLQQSVHGRGTGPGGQAERVAPGGKERRKPTCTDCHQKHEISDPEAEGFRLNEPNLCGNCHARLSSRYNLSMHGQLTRLGFGPAAKCADCHGAHEIFALDDPRSMLSAENRQQTCQKCHSSVTGNFLKFDPHLGPEDSPIVHAVALSFMTLLLTIMGFFTIHSVLWFVRILIDVLKHGRPHRLRPGEHAYLRFSTGHRVGHVIGLIAFLGLAATGLPLKYASSAWAQKLARALGGFASTGVWHRVFAVVLFGCLFVFLLQLVLRVIVGRREGVKLSRLFFGPDSLVPTLRDVSDFFRMLRWFIGLGPKPTFERWTYWEKIDFWGATADTVIIGVTGLILWFPNLFCYFLPAVTINIAKVIHSTQALLATAFVFAIHFFNTHFRADRFPADMSILTGLVSKEELEEDRPEYMERMRREGRLEALKADVPPRGHLWLIMLGGYVALVIGLALLAGIIVASLGG